MRGMALVAALLLAMPAAAQHHGHGGVEAPPPICTRPDPACADTAAPAFGPDGSLYLAWAQGGHVWVGRSTDRGRQFGLVARVNPAPQPIDDNGENRPKLAIDQAGRVFVTYTVKAARPFTGNVLFSRSLDGGSSFAPPRSLSDEGSPVSLRFDTIAVAPSGRLYAAWIDKRRSGEPGYRGAALAVAWSDDGGASFSANRIAQDHSCECCRTAMTLDQRGLPLVMWRHVFAPNIRDHALLDFANADTPGSLQRVSEDDWAVDACPHHGPGLAVGADGRRHAVWFTQGRVRQGLFYAHAEPGGAFSAPMPLGDPARAPSHAHVAAAGHEVVAAWKEFDGAATVILAIRSRDGGETWSAPTRLAETADASDHPLLVVKGGEILLSWLTRAEGYRLIAVRGGT